jgi:hypothetical protein
MGIKSVESEKKYAVGVMTVAARHLLGVDIKPGKLPGLADRVGFGISIPEKAGLGWSSEEVFEEISKNVLVYGESLDVVETESSENGKWRKGVYILASDVSGKFPMRMVVMHNSEKNILIVGLPVLKDTFKNILESVYHGPMYTVDVNKKMEVGDGLISLVDNEELNNRSLLTIVGFGNPVKVVDEVDSHQVEILSLAYPGRDFQEAVAE